MSFGGLHVLSLESRRAVEMERLIRNQGGDPFVAPSMREVPLENNLEAIDFAARLMSGDFDLVMFLTGVGARILREAVETRFPSEEFLQALRRTKILVRGAKPSGVMREWNVPVTFTVPEPNTWREILATLGDSHFSRIAIQEYGRPADELFAALRARGSSVTSVPVYQYEIASDTTLLKEAARRLAANQIDVVLLTTAVQISYLLQVAAEMGIEEQVRQGLTRAKIGSIGPTTSEALRELGFDAAFEPSHPKMGFLVAESARAFGAPS